MTYYPLIDLFGGLGLMVFLFLVGFGLMDYLSDKQKHMREREK